jgi:hypothetical protein
VVFYKPSIACDATNNRTTLSGGDAMHVTRPVAENFLLDHGFKPSAQARQLSSQSDTFSLSRVQQGCLSVLPNAPMTVIPLWYGYRAPQLIKYSALLF